MRILRPTLLLVVICALAAACGTSNDEPATGSSPSDSADPNSADPNSADPNSADPNSADLDSADPNSADPNSAATSDDGALSLSLPADGSEITITTIDGGTTFDDLTALTTYDLGPDGATFSPALNGRIEVDPDALAGGVTLLHETDDGVLEALDFEITDGGLDFELDSFSRIHLATGESRRGAFDVFLSAPDEVAVGNEIPVTFDLRSDDTALSYNRLTVNADGYRTTGQIGGTNELFTCADVGSGLIEYSGTVRVRVPVDQPGGLTFSLAYYLGFAVGDASVEVRCVAPGIQVPPYDTRCTERSTGETSTTCPDANELAFSFSYVDDQLSVSLERPTDAEVTHSITQQGDDFRVIEISTDGTTNGFYGAGFQSYTPEGETPVVDLATGTLSGLMIDTAAGDPLVMFPGGTTFEGGALEPTNAPWIDFTVYIDLPDGAFGTYYWNMPATLLGE